MLIGIIKVLCALLCVQQFTAADGQASSSYITIAVKVSNTLTKTKITIDTPKPSFESCVCNTTASFCSTSSTISATIEKNSKNVTKADAAGNTQNVDGYFVCTYKRSTKEVSCVRNTSNSTPCNTEHCFVNIIIGCPSEKNIPIVWDESQDARVIDSKGVTLENCCSDVQSTTTELTSTTNTSPTTSFLSTQPASIPITASASIVDTPAGTKTSSVEKTSLNATIDSTAPGSANTDQQNSDASTTISGAHIGIIVGTAVAAILLTLIVVLVIWKFKSRRRNHEEETIRPKSSQQDLGNPEITYTEVVKVRANDRKDKPLKSVAHVSPLVQSRDTEYNVAIGDYTYIDQVGLHTANINNTNHSVRQVVPDNHLCTVAPESTAEPESTKASESTAGENQSVYTKLGENKAPRENTYNYLAPVTCDGTTSLVSESGTDAFDNAYSNIASTKTDAIPAHPNSTHSSHGNNTQLKFQPCSSDTTNHPTVPSRTTKKTTEIVDVTPATYTEMRILPHKADITNDHPITGKTADTIIPGSGDQNIQEFKPNVGSFEDTFSEKNLEEPYENLETNAQSFSNDIYSTQQELTESNSSQSSVDTTYANFNE